MKNKYASYSIIILLGINIILMLLEYTLDITLYYDVCNEILGIVWVVLIVVYPYKRHWYIVVCKIIGIIVVLTASLVVFVANIDSQYGELHSPNNTNQVILKQTNEFGIHHRYYSVEVYKRIGGIFKRYSNSKIYVYDSPLFIGEEIREVAPNSYSIDYDLYIEWLNEDVLHLYIDKDRIRDDEVLDIIISLDN